MPLSSSPEPIIVSSAPVSLQPCQATAPPQLASNSLPYVPQVLKQAFDKIDARLTATINEPALAA